MVSVQSMGLGLADAAEDLSEASFPTRGGAETTPYKFAKSLYSHFTLPEIAALAKEVEKAKDTLRYFPPGSYLEFSAEGDRGSYCESSWRTLYVELKFKGLGSRGSGRESISISSSPTAAVRRYLKSLSNPGASDEVDSSDWR